MQRVLILIALIAAGGVAWKVGEGLSSDSMSMGIGIILGIVATIPMGLLLMASQRHGTARGGYDDAPTRPPRGLPYEEYGTRHSGNAPIIVLGGYPQIPAQPQPRAPELPAWPTGGGQYKMLGTDHQDSRFRDDGQGGWDNDR